MITNRKSTMMAPAYTRICTMPMKKAPSRVKMAATEKEVPISHMAQATGFWRVTIASAQPMAHAAKKKNRIWVNVICIGSSASGPPHHRHRVVYRVHPQEPRVGNPGLERHEVRLRGTMPRLRGITPNSPLAPTGLKSGLQPREVRLRGLCLGSEATGRLHPFRTSALPHFRTSVTPRPDRSGPTAA